MSGTVKWYLHWITRKILPENAPVRLTSAQLEELDYRRLYRAYSPKGRKSAADPRVMFKVMAYGYQCRIYSSRGWEEACWYRVDFMWLLEEENVSDHATFARFRKRCAVAGRSTKENSVSWAKDATAMPRPTRTPHSCA